jgi:hypothetical protein
MLDVLIEFKESTLVEEKFNSFSSCKFVIGVLSIDSGFSTANKDFFVDLLPSLEEWSSLGGRCCAEDS